MLACQTARPIPKTNLRECSRRWEQTVRVSWNKAVGFTTFCIALLARRRNCPGAIPSSQGGSAFCRPSVEGMMSVVTSMSYARQSCWGSPRHQWPQRWPAFRVKHGETWGVFQTSGCLHDVYICLPLFTHVSQRIWNVDVVCHLYGSKICSLI